MENIENHFVMRNIRPKIPQLSTIENVKAFCDLDRAAPRWQRNNEE